MDAVPLVAPAGPVTWHEVQAMAPDGRRYESFGGVLAVTLSPGLRHQRAVARLTRLLDDAAPAELEVVPSPYDWVVGPTEWFQPDVVVLRSADADLDGPLRATPVLLVEVLSPSTRLVDLHAKRAAYAENGCPFYWVVDPGAPSVTCLELLEGRYREVARGEGAGRVQIERPFRVAVAPADLTRS